MRWHTKSLNIKCHKVHHVCLHTCGGCDIFRHKVGCELHRHHEPMAHEVLQVRMCDLERGPALVHHKVRGKEKQRPLNPRNLLSLSLSPFSGTGRRREGDDSLCETTKGCAWVTVYFYNSAGLVELRVPRQNLPAGSALPKVNIVRDKATQRMASSWHYLRPR
jgi:hypothetical protein